MKYKTIIFLILILVYRNHSAQDLLSVLDSGDYSQIEGIIGKNHELINKKMSNDMTPLLYAASKNNIELIKILLSNGAEANAVYKPDYYGLTPVTFAVSKNNLEAVKILIKNGADIQYRTRLGENYLHFAAALNKAEIAEYLIDNGIDINSVKNGALTPLHIASITGSNDVIKMLIKKGANLELKSNDFATPLHFAVAAKNKETADILKNNGAKDTPRQFPLFKGKYFSKNPPNGEPEPFIPELFRDIYRASGSPVFSPDGKELFFYCYIMPGIGYSRIWWMREVNGVWTAPELAPFSDYESWGPSLSPDGYKIYFSSRRPKNGNPVKGNDIWYSEKINGKWSPPIDPGSPPNRDNFNEMNFVISKDGSIYFKAFGAGTKGTQLFKSEFKSGKYLPPVSIDDMIDKGTKDNSTDVEFLFPFDYGGPGYAEISAMFHKEDGTWSAPIYLGDKFHRGEGSIDGALSPDGKYFFFVQNISPYWVDASFLNSLRKEALKNNK